jgi:hypothetical protein
MTLWETAPRTISEQAPDIVSEMDQPMAPETGSRAIPERPGTGRDHARFPGLTDRIKRRRRRVLGLSLLLSGLLLGWLVVGWWLWPVQWINTFPWDLRSDYQKKFVELVANDYWQSGDVSQARQALSGWDEEELAQLLATMRAQASSFEVRQRLAALVEALALPDYRVSPLSVLLGQKAIVLSFLLSLSPLVLAGALAVSPLIRDKTKQPDGLWAKLTDSFVEEATGEPGELWEQGEPYEGTQPGESPDAEEVTAGQETEEATGAAPGELEDEENEEEDEDWWEEDEEEDSNASVGDILMSIFEEEVSDLPHLEALARDLPEIKIDDLIRKGQRLAQRLQKSNTLRTASEQ